MKLVFRFFLLVGLLLAVAAPFGAAAETACILPAPVLSTRIEPVIRTIDGVGIGNLGVHTGRIHEAPVFADAVFEVEPEDRDIPESNFSRKLAEVTGYFTSFFDPAAASSLLKSTGCSLLRGHFSFCSRRHIILCVIRI